jgi:hypothetical protein
MAHLAHLFNIKFDTETPTTTWTTFSEYLQERIGPKSNPFFSPHPVAYQDGVVKAKHLNEVKGTADYNNCNTIVSCLTDYKSLQGTIYLFIVNLDPRCKKKPPKGDEPQAQEAESEKVSNWHSVIVHIQKGVVGI